MTGNPLTRAFARLAGGPSDPYWDTFIRREPADPRALLGPQLRAAGEGLVYPIKTEVHDPRAMTGHLRELSRFFGADLLGVAACTPEALLGIDGQAPGDSAAPLTAAQWAEQFPFAVQAAIAWQYDQERDRGVGGQWGDLKTAVIAFNLASYIRELGYRATTTTLHSPALAAAAGLGTLTGQGKLRTPQFGEGVWLAYVVVTDLPLEPAEAGGARV